MTETKSYLDKGGAQQEYIQEVVHQGIKGAAMGLGTFLPLSYLATRRFPVYRALPLPGKAFLGLMCTVPAGVIFAEKAGEHYIAKHQWASSGLEELNHEKMKAEQRWQSLSTTEKIKDWSARHQYGIIGGSWLASLGIAFGIVARDKYQTFPQKLVQARMWAQGLTVSVLIVSAVLAGVNAKGEKPAQPIDHSWKDMLEQGGNLTKAQRIALHSARKAPVDKVAAAQSAPAVA